MKFNVNKAVVDLRNAFYDPIVSQALELTKENINFFVSEPVLRSIQDERESNIEGMRDLLVELEQQFPEANFIKGRVKSLHSILGKLMKGRSIADTFGIKIIVKSEEVQECYYVLKWANEHFKIIDFDDRIKTPKGNGYRDLKFVVDKEGVPVEFIVQTPDMYRASKEECSHENYCPWKYTDAIKNLPVEYKQIEIEDLNYFKEIQ